MEGTRSRPSPALVLLRWLPAAIAAGSAVALTLAAVTLLLAAGAAA